MDEREPTPADPSKLGIIYFGCAVMASAAISVVIGIAQAVS